MEKTLIGGFGDFLYNDFNSTEEFIRKLPDKPDLIKKIFPVGYFKRDFLKPIMGNDVKRVIFLGMHENIDKPRFEVFASNHKVTLKNPIYRFFVNLYSYILRLFGKNLRISKPLKKKYLTLNKIDNCQKRGISLHTRPPKLGGFDISKDAGNYVCNYGMYVTESFIKTRELDVDFYFIHIPKRLSNYQKRVLKKFILKLF